MKFLKGLTTIEYAIAGSLVIGSIVLSFSTLDEGNHSVADLSSQIQSGVDDTASHQVKNEVDSAIENLPLALAYFGAPTSMNLEATEEVKVIITYKELENLKEKLPNVINEEPVLVKVSDRFQVILKNASFDIIEQTPTIQAISNYSSAEWSWEIKPRSDGEYTLKVYLYALIFVNGKETPKFIETYSKNIEVKVTQVKKVTDTLKEHEGWIAAIAIPILTAFWLLFLYFKRNKKQKTS